MLVGCHDLVKITIVLPMPYPDCLDTNYFCKYSIAGRRTNPSNQAISQYLIQEISKLQANKIDLVYSHNIISSNLTSVINCGCHFLCRDDKIKVWYKSLTGIEFASEIVHAACK